MSTPVPTLPVPVEELDRLQDLAMRNARKALEEDGEFMPVAQCFCRRVDLPAYAGGARMEYVAGDDEADLAIAVLPLAFSTERLIDAALADAPTEAREGYLAKIAEFAKAAGIEPKEAAESTLKALMRARKMDRGALELILIQGFLREVKAFAWMRVCEGYVLRGDVGVEPVRDEHGFSCLRKDERSSECIVVSLETVTGHRRMLELAFVRAVRDSTERPISWGEVLDSAKTMSKVGGRMVTALEVPSPSSEAH